MEAEPLLAMCDDIVPLAHFTPTSLPAQPCDTDSVSEGGRESGVCLAADVEAFLARLRREQVRFLDAISAARLELYSEPGQLAKAAALQARLTQRFLDAQRSILRGRAEVEAKVARIAEDADADALGGNAQAPGATICPEIAERAVVVDGTCAGAESLASMVNAAFESDGAQAERQLRSLLDDWWRAEGQECRAELDDAHARAAMRLHVARSEAGDVTEDSRAEARDAVPTIEPVEPAEPAALLPGSLLAALDTIDHTGLDQLLVSLLDALGTPSAEHGPPPPSAAPTIDSAPLDDAFDSFWGAGSAHWTHRVARNWVVAHVLFPTVTVVAGLALVLAWTG